MEININGSNTRKAGRMTEAIPINAAQIIQLGWVVDIQFFDLMVDHHAHNIQTVK
tara:strand:+ start:268 stop:432 length:165 start_codon:yes stop_codon:yes gene_type:complete